MIIQISSTKMTHKAFFRKPVAVFDIVS